MSAENVPAVEPARVPSAELVAFLSSGRVDPRHKVCGPIDYGTTGLQVCTAGGHGQWGEAGCPWAVRVAAGVDAFYGGRVAELEAVCDLSKALAESLASRLRSAWDRAEAAEAERDALRAQVEAVRALAAGWEFKAGENSAAWAAFGPQGVGVPFAVEQIRAALSSSEPVTVGEDEPDPVEVEARRLCKEYRASLPPHVSTEAVWEDFAERARTNLAAGEVTPPAEQRDEDQPHPPRHYKSVFLPGLCGECGLAWPCVSAPAPTTEGARPMAEKRVRLRCGATGIDIGKGWGLFVSCMDNDLGVDRIDPEREPHPSLPIPSVHEVEAAKAVIHTALEASR